jgi:transposase-like protein
MEDQQNIDVRRSRRTHEQIQNLLTEFGKSGYTVREFCRQHNLSAGTFHKWQSRHKSKPLKKANGTGFASLVIDSYSKALYAEVKGIRLYQPVSAAYLKELMA